MFTRKLKTGYFVLEGLNSFAVTYYCYYIYFFLQTAYGFGNRANLAVAALSGLVYIPASIGGGRFAQRFGYFTALKLGYAVMIAALTAGLWVTSSSAQVAVLMVAVAGVCLIWPTLEALVSEGEDPAGVPHMIGIYNVVWAATAALAYFCGGALLTKLGLRSMFWVPIAILAAQFLITLWLEKQAGHPHGRPVGHGSVATTPPLPPRRVAESRLFVRLAWLANPFAYIAINTLIAVMPGIAHKLGLSTMAAGFCCSLWCFSRFAAFTLLWLWTDWHYRFSWLLTAYLTLIATFAALLLVPHLATIIAAEILFGLAVGLIYYSSLFYSMDSSATKGEHGGIHEAAIGLGNLAGPAVGATSLYLAPNHPQSGALAVTGLLIIGLVGLIGIRQTRSRYTKPRT